MELCEELRIKDVEVVLRLLWNDVVLKEAEIEQDQYVIQVHSRLQEFEIFLGYFYCPIKMPVYQLADHFVVFKTINFGSVVVV